MKLTIREAWNILHGPTGKAHTPENQAAWDVINCFGIYGDTLEEMENGENYEREHDATGFGLDEHPGDDGRPVED